MIVRYRLGAFLLSGALIAGCSGKPQATPTMPYQVTPIVVTPTLGSYPPAGTTSTTNTTGTYPTPPVQVTANPAYPAPIDTSDPQGRSKSAIESLSVAQNIAKEQFDPNAKLYAIDPSQVTIRNLGSMPTRPGWFYRFKVAGAPREFYVQVVNGEVSGTTPTEPIAQTKPLELPIDLATVKLTSDQVFAKFQQKAPDLGLKVTDPRTYDLELVNLEGVGAPVWSVYDPATYKWLYAVNATTGDEVPNPHGK